MQNNFTNNPSSFILQNTYAPQNTCATAPPNPNYVIDLSAFISRYEINQKYIPFIQKVKNYASIIICDDSGSMMSPADPDTASGVSRWDELKKSVQIVADFHQCMNIPFFIYFINRGYIPNPVTSWKEIENWFINPPSGYTNIIKVLNIVKANHTGVDHQPPIIHIFTDGHPTNESGTEDINGFNTWLSSEQFNKNVFYSLVLCTDDEETDIVYRSIERYVRNTRKTTIGIDVTEDYRGELRDVIKRRGVKYRFTYGDYIVKILCGAIDPTIHDIDLPDNSCACTIC